MNCIQQRDEHVTSPYHVIPLSIEQISNKEYEYHQLKTLKTGFHVIVTIAVKRPRGSLDVYSIWGLNNRSKVLV